MQELEKLFAASGSSAVVEKKSVASEDPKLKLFVLDHRRAQNVVIGLSQFRSKFSHKQLLEAVCRLDDLDGSLNVDKLQNLTPLLPTEHEAKRMDAAADSQQPSGSVF